MREDKTALRKEVRERKNMFSEEELKAYSERICGQLLRHGKVLEAETVFAYWSLSDEVCTHRLVTKLLAMGKTVLLPKVVSDTQMTIHRLTALSDLSEGAYGIMEPTTEALPQEMWTELLQHNGVGLIPGMAFDKAMHRMGRGKGYYDRVLAKLPGMYKIGVCFPFQLYKEIPATNLDVLMNEVCCG